MTYKELQMIKKIILSVLLSSGLSLQCYAQEVKTHTVNGQEANIYENFQLKKSNGDQSLKSDLSSENRTVIASLMNDIQAVQADKNDSSNIALVVPADNQPPYVIKTGIYYKCRKNSSNCIPSGIVAKQLGTSRLYKAEAYTFAEWTRVMDILKQSSEITKIMPEYDYGTVNVLK